MSAKGSNYIGCFLNNINNIHVVHITCFGFYCIPSMYFSYKVSNLPNIWYMCLVNHSIPALFPACSHLLINIFLGWACQGGWFGSWYCGGRGWGCGGGGRGCLFMFVMSSLTYFLILKSLITSWEKKEKSVTDIRTNRGTDQ